MFPNYKRTNPPLWLERNFWFRKAYILRRLLHHSGGRYSSDSDRFIKRIFKHLQDQGLVSKSGFFVDVGCYHPVRGNTTYVLYRRGWQGINIDVDSIKIEAFNLRRPRDTNITCAVSKEPGEMKYWRKGLWSIYNSLEHKEASKAEGFREMVVKVDTLTNLIDATPHKDHQIDFLSVDVEGHDLEVLQSLDFVRYCPKVICIETWESSLSDVMRSQLYSFMMDKGYALVNWVSSNLVFLHQDYPHIQYP